MLVSVSIRGKNLIRKTKKGDTTMETNVKELKQKKGFLSAIWESMTKTGGCCGSSGDCCGSSQPNNVQQKKMAKQDASASCCGK